MLVGGGGAASRPAAALVARPSFADSDSVPGRSAADVLLALLDHVDDATTLEILLEDLVAILRARGLSDAEIAGTLKAGSPGEVLLSIFEEGVTASALLELVPDGPARVRARRAERSASAVGASSPADQPYAPPGAAVTSTAMRATTAQAAVPAVGPNMVGGGLVLVAGIAAPLLAMMDPGLALIFLANAAATLAGATVLGAIGGAIFVRGRAKVVAGIVGGALASPGALIASALYLQAMLGAGRTSIMRLEIALAACVGLVPGWLIGRLLARRGG
jgi:hypothetical protein